MSDSRSNPSRRPSTPTAALDALLAESAGDPIRRAMWLDELDRRLRPFLPFPLAAHARLANYERGRLVFVVKTSLVPNTPPLQAPRKTVTMSPAAKEALQAALASLKPDTSGSNGAG